MQTIGLTYDPKSRLLTADSEGAGTTIDDCAVTFSIEPITGATLYLVCGVTTGSTRIERSCVMSKSNNCAST